jgi:hypothetical protein
VWQSIFINPKSILWVLRKFTFNKWGEIIHFKNQLGKFVFRGFLAGYWGVLRTTKWSLNLLFRRGFGSVVSVLVPSMLAVVPLREVAGSTPGLDFYLLCEPICVSLCLFHWDYNHRNDWPPTCLAWCLLHSTHDKKTACIITVIMNNINRHDRIMEVHE